MATELDKTKATEMLDLCRAAAETSPMPMAGVEGEGQTVCYVNPAFCRLVGEDRDELLGTCFADIPAVGAECALLVERVCRTGKPETLSVRERSGSLPLCSYAMWPVWAPESSSPGIIVQVIEETSVYQDAISMNEALMLGVIRQHEQTEVAVALNELLQAEMLARKKAEEALIRSEKLASAGRMSAVIAHEINNPLAAVMDLIYLAQGAQGLPEAVSEYLSTADAELKRVAHITRQTLGFYRETAAPTTFEIGSLLDSLVDLLRGKIRARQATLDLQCERGLEITAVHGELRQVLSNLLVNSLDALGQNGRVTIRASSSRGALDGLARIRLTVSDNGRGMDPAVAPQLFQPFFTTKGTTGNGLGLWVSKQLIEKHGGAIRLRSRQTGKHCGTSFSVTLPKSGT